MRPSSSLVAAALAVPALLGFPAVAHADAPTCSITGTSPGQVVVGATAELVQFGVAASCDEAGGAAVKWSVQAENFPHSAHVSWLGACNYHYAGPSVLDCEHDGATTVRVIGSDDATFTGEHLAGTVHPLGAFAFADLNADDRYDSGEPYATYQGTFTLLRRTAFEQPISVNHQERRSGQHLILSARIMRANWTTGREQGLDAPVTLQFRADGQSGYQDVETVQADNGRLRVKLRAASSGSWRYVFAGSATDAGSTSDSIDVPVQPARH
jgi:hypothetical protein